MISYHYMFFPKVFANALFQKGIKWWLFFQIRHKQKIYSDQHYLPCSALIKCQF